MTIGSAAVACPTTVSKSNWATDDTYGDTFSVTQSGVQITVTRSDKPEGWGMDLRFNCCPATTSPTPAPTKVGDTWAPTPTPQLTDGNIRTAANAWIDNPAAATTTYGAISEWDVSAVSNTTNLFYQKPTFNADISKWNVASVTTLSYTFSGAAAFNHDIGKWNTARVTNVDSTFYNAAAFNHDIGKWNVAAVTTLYRTFNFAASFNRDISDWNTARVANMQSTFNGAAAFNRDIGEWNVAS